MKRASVFWEAGVGTEFCGFRKEGSHEKGGIEYVGEPILRLLCIRLPTVFVPKTWHLHDGGLDHPLLMLLR